MSLVENAQVNSIRISSTTEELLIKEIILTHDADDHCIDSELLLHLVEGAFHPTTENGLDAISTRDINLSVPEEPISLIIYKVSNQIASQCFEDENLHNKALLLLKMLGPYTWDGKVAITLASFAHSFILFRLISQLQSEDALAIALATFKRLPRAFTKLKRRLKAMNLLVNTMLKVTKIIIRFEGMSLQHELVDADVLGITKSKIYLATYWIFRSILLCSLEIADFKHLELDEHLDKTVIAAWGLHTVGSKLNSLCRDLEEHVDKCQQQIDARFPENLLNIFKENQVDNQKVLRALFDWRNELPLKNSSTGEKFSILELRNKVVILLISKPDLLPLDKMFLLVQQTHDHSQQKKLAGSYAILWVPISSCHEWRPDEKSSYEFFSNNLPWFSIRRPWLLNPTTVNFMKQEWSFEEDPIMVVLNENGSVSNTNATDLVCIWGLKAFPFLTSREKEMWEQENWIQDFLISAGLMEEGKDLCVYGSGDIVWIREFTATMKKIKRSGIKLEVVYVGCRDPGENVKAIIDTIDQEKLCASLTFRMVQIFWFQLERIKRWSSHQDHVDTTASELAALLELNDNENWAVMCNGGSTDVLKLDAGKIKECMQVFPLWGKNVATMGLVGAVRSGLEQKATWHDGQIIPYEEGMNDTLVELVCGWCKRPMEKFVVYKCEG